MLHSKFYQDIEYINRDKYIYLKYILDINLLSLPTAYNIKQN